MDMGAFCYIRTLCSEVVLHRSMVCQRREVESVCHGDMCILVYVKLIWCSGFPEI